MKIYGVELEECEAQDVCKLFKNKKDAEYYAGIAQQILNLDKLFMRCIGALDYRDDEKLYIELSAGIGSDINDIANMWGISTFFDYVRIREYDVE